MSLKDKPSVVLADGTTVVATWRSALLSVLGRVPLDPRSAEAHVAACEAHARRVGPEQLVEIVLLDGLISIPSKEVRAVLDEAAVRLGPYYRCVGVVFDSRSFRSTVIRGIFRSFELASPRPLSYRIFSATRPCIRWVQDQARAVESFDCADSELLEAISIMRGHGQRAGILALP